MLFSFSGWYLLSFALLFLAGVGIACFATMQSSLVLTSASDAMRGRAMGVLMLAIGFGPLGALQIGVLASAVGASMAVAVSAGAGVLVLALVLWKARALRRIGADARP
jgi:predicted MFS family arabinose efflux permease